VTYRDPGLRLGRTLVIGDASYLLETEYLDLLLMRRSPLKLGPVRGGRKTF
jgi:hypothetical protein